MEFKKYFRLLVTISIFFIQENLNADYYSEMAFLKPEVESYLQERITNYNMDLSKTLCFRLVSSFNLNAFAYSFSKTLCIDQSYNDLIQGIVENRKSITITFRDLLGSVALTLPRECAICIVDWMILHEAGHIIENHNDSTIKNEVVADDHSAQSFNGIIGGILIFRMFSLLLLNGDKTKIHKGKEIYLQAGFGDSHPSHYEREAFFKRKLDHFLANNPTCASESLKLFTLANQITIKIDNKREFSNNYFDYCEVGKVRNYQNLCLGAVAKVRTIIQNKLNL
jgi:hypothetical protein